MSCLGCNASIDCPADEVFPYTLTQGSTFPYVINCPTGFDCSGALEVTMNCCGTPTTIVIPADATPAERVALVQALVAQCEFIEQGCDGGGGGPDAPDPGDPPTPTTQFYYSRARTTSVSCSSAFGGGTYVTTVSAGRFIAATQAAADALALAFIASQVTTNRFCLNAPCLCPCADEATTLNINTVGGTGPFTFEITSGTLPTGLTMAFVGGVLRVTGTPTVPGNSTITVKVYDSVGGTLTKNLTFYVIEITPSNLSDGTVDVVYSEQLDVDGGVGPYVFSLLSGSLPDGLTLSDEGLISGTPTTSSTSTFTVLAVDTGITGHTGCQREYEVEIIADYPFQKPMVFSLRTFGFAALDHNTAVFGPFPYAIIPHQLDFGDGFTYTWASIGDTHGLSVASDGEVTGNFTELPAATDFPDTIQTNIETAFGLGHQYVAWMNGYPWQIILPIVITATGVGPNAGTWQYLLRIEMCLVVNGSLTNAADAGGGSVSMVNNLQLPFSETLFEFTGVSGGMTTSLFKVGSQFKAMAICAASYNPLGHEYTVAIYESALVANPYAGPIALELIGYSDGGFTPAIGPGDPASGSVTYTGS